mmetsp:Transcript_58504/g.93005  ORF Transcript_58504/g.93005 Transcript_58504/m.93005 type:complete len:209 (-) Transcript_58504:64-690(-)
MFAFGQRFGGIILNRFAFQKFQEISSFALSLFHKLIRMQVFFGRQKQNIWLFLIILLSLRRDLIVAELRESHLVIFPLYSIGDQSAVNRLIRDIRCIVDNTRHIVDGFIPLISKRQRLIHNIEELRIQIVAETEQRVAMFLAHLLFGKHIGKVLVFLALQHVGLDADFLQQLLEKEIGKSKAINIQRGAFHQVRFVADGRQQILLHIH